jgi:two-component sensor histidine kinase
VKHGRIEINWSVDKTNDGEKRLKFGWKEAGGPPVSSNDERGFGRQVLENLAPTALGGSGKLSFSPDGVAWTLSADNACVN